MVLVTQGRGCSAGYHRATVLVGGSWSLGEDVAAGRGAMVSRAQDANSHCSRLWSPVFCRCLPWPKLPGSQRFPGTGGRAGQGNRVDMCHPSPQPPCYYGQ